MKTNNKKLTRNSFKRKIIVFGVAVFMSVAMVATGFAAWIISSNAQADGGVDVGVATITESNLKIELNNFATDNNGEYTFLNEKFSFGPDATDKDGYLKASENADDVEKLSVTISGKVINYENLGALRLEIDLTALASAIEAKYIKLNMEGATLKTVGSYVYVVDLKTGAYDEDDGTFSIELKLAWGEYFGNVNPGFYFDNAEYTGFEGLTDDAIAKKINDELTALNAALTGNIQVTIIAEVA